MYRMLITLFFLLISSTSTSEPVNTKVDEKESIQNTVSTFYNDYIKYMEKDASDDFLLPNRTAKPATSSKENIAQKLSLIEYLETKKDIAHSFAQKTDTMLKNLVKDYGEMAVYDPILLAQDIPFLEYSEPQIKGSGATITIYKVWEGDTDKTKDTIEVSLKKIGEIWKITDIVDTSAIE